MEKNGVKAFVVEYHGPRPFKRLTSSPSEVQHKLAKVSSLFGNLDGKLNNFMYIGQFTAVKKWGR